MAEDSSENTPTCVCVAKRRMGSLCLSKLFVTCSGPDSLSLSLSLTSLAKYSALSFSGGRNNCTRPWLHPFHPILSAHRKKASLSHNERCTDIEVYIGERAKVGKETLQPVQRRRRIFCSVCPNEMCGGVMFAQAPAIKSGQRINSSR